MTRFLKNNWLIILVELLVISAFCVLYGRYGDIYVDSFREAYISEQMLSGKLLYKNIFCIYPPLGYMINALLFKFFGVSLKVLYFAGLFSAIGIFYFINKICKKFFDNLITSGILLFCTAGFVFSPNVFNPVFPYSYGMLYGLLFALISIYFALTKKFPLSYLFCSLAICSKIEFMLLLPALIYLSKKESWRKNFILFILPFIVVIMIILLQGTEITDILTSLGLIQITGQTDTIKEFYWSMGLIPTIHHIPLYLQNFLKFIFPFPYLIYQEIATWIFPVSLVLFMFKRKKLSEAEIFFVLSSILVSLKVFFGLTMQSYGVFYLSFALISICILLKGRLKKIFGIYLIVWALIIGYNNSQILIKKNFIISNEKGIVKVLPKDGKIISETIKFVDTLPNEAVVVIYPEELAVNYFTGRKSDDKFYSLIPLYTEVFGEETIIKRLEIKKPDYIIINDYNTFAYGFSKFGKDYAQNVMRYINDTYKKITPIETVHDILIYKK